VTGKDRALAHKLMKLMPKNQRGDFVFFDPALNRKFSNNAALADASTISPRFAGAAGPPAAPATSRRASSVRTRDDYTSSCGPDQPHRGTGPYGRMVSKCGFTGGIGFVNVACGTSLMPTGDQGNLYFAVNAGPNTAAEGGLQYNSDSSIQPYTAGLNATLNNATAKYACGQDLVISFGPVYGENIVFAEVGQSPSSFDPRKFWDGSQEIVPNNAAWTFTPSPSQFSGTGTDGYGTPSPCMNCAISKITSIAQHGDADDGAVFGVNGNNLNDIHWMQVAFGNWLNGCRDGQLCTLRYSYNQFTYYGGEQEYYGLSGNPDVVYQDGPTPSGFGPYETYDGIILPGGRYASGHRLPDGAFTAPTPPPNATPAPVAPPCTLDSSGYCVYAIDRHTSTSPCYNESGIRDRVLTGYINYTITDSTMTNTVYELSYSPSAYCSSDMTWSPDPTCQDGLVPATSNI